MITALNQETSSYTIFLMKPFQLCIELLQSKTRMIKKLTFRPKGDKILTKGDNNPVDDRGLYPRNMLYLDPEHLLGKVIA